MLKQIVIILVVAGLAYLMGAGANQKVVNNPVVTKTVTVAADTSNWKALKEVDDQVFQQAGAGFGVCSQSIKDAGNYDVTALNNDTANFGKVTDKVNSLNVERQAILSKLGY